MKIYVARHGETVENQQKRILGHTPGTLTPAGQAEGRALAAQAKELGIELVLASDLARAKATCAFLDKSLPVEFTPLLRERNFGAREGELRKDVDWQGLWDSPDEPQLSAVIGAEPLDAFTRRIAQFASSLFATYGESQKTILLVTHIGVMNRLHFLAALDAFSFVDFPNARATLFDLETIARHCQHFL